MALISYHFPRTNFESIYKSLIGIIVCKMQKPFKGYEVTEYRSYCVRTRDSWNTVLVPYSTGTTGVEVSGDSAE